jgi:hypothetical protein
MSKSSSVSESIILYLINEINNTCVKAHILTKDLKKENLD